MSMIMAEIVIIMDFALIQQKTGELYVCRTKTTNRSRNLS
jgi:hypothetical protein